MITPAVAGLALLLLAACTSMPVERVEPMPFHSTHTFFDGNDRIEIVEVSAQDKAFRPGAEVRVRGRYRLVSCDQAWLYFGLTNGEIQGDVWHDVQRGEGEFEFVARVIQPGLPHVSLYSGDGAYNCIGKHAFEVRGAGP